MKAILKAILKAKSKAITKSKMKAVEWYTECELYKMKVLKKAIECYTECIGSLHRLYTVIT